MNTDKHRYLNDITEPIIAAAYEVSNVLGAGSLERVYHNALRRELTSRGLPCESQKRLSVRYKGTIVGKYIADLINAEKLIVELKCVQAFAQEHLAQCLNYLKATRYRLGLLLNFQHSKVEVRRVVSNF